jgi:hypothetical protein
MTWRAFGVLLDGLPPESRVRTAVVNHLGAAEIARMAKATKGARQFAAFSHTDHVLAAIHDVLNQLIVVTISLNGGKPKIPEPMYRPGVQPPAHENVDPLVKNFMTRRRARIKQEQALERARRLALPPAPPPQE